MKKLFSIFACVILLISVCAFPMFAADKQTEMNINDMILLHCDSGLSDNDTASWYYPTGFMNVSAPSISNKIDRFLSLILFNSSLDSSLFSFDDIQSWRSSIFLDEQLKNDYTFTNSCSEFVGYYNLLSSKNPVYVGFSPLFVQQLNSYYKSFCDSIGVDSSLYPLNFDSVYSGLGEWYLQSGVYVYYYRSSSGFSSIYPDKLFLVSYNQYLLEKSSGLLNFWLTLSDRIDIPSFVSWLPSAISNQFVFYFASFFALSVILVGIKILHG